MGDALFNAIACFSPSVPPLVERIWRRHGGQVPDTDEQRCFADYYFCAGLDDAWCKGLSGRFVVVFHAGWVLRCASSGFLLPIADFILDDSFDPSKHSAYILSCGQPTDPSHAASGRPAFSKPLALFPCGPTPSEPSPDDSHFDSLPGDLSDATLVNVSYADDPAPSSSKDFAHDKLTHMAAHARPDPVTAFRAGLASLPKRGLVRFRATPEVAFVPSDEDGDGDDDAEDNETNIEEEMTVTKALLEDPQSVHSSSPPPSAARTRRAHVAPAPRLPSPSKRRKHSIADPIRLTSFVLPSPSPSPLPSPSPSPPPAPESRAAPPRSGKRSVTRVVAVDDLSHVQDRGPGDVFFIRRDPPDPLAVPHRPDPTVLPQTVRTYSLPKVARRAAPPDVKRDPLPRRSSARSASSSHTPTLRQLLDRARRRAGPGSLPRLAVRDVLEALRDEQIEDAALFVPGQELDGREMGFAER